MPKKLKKIGCRVAVVTDEPDDSSAKLDVMAQLNYWDKQYQELQLGSENKCRKKRVGLLEFLSQSQGLGRPAERSSLAQALSDQEGVRS